MNTGLVASRYANALYLFARDNGSIDRVYADVLSLRGSLSDNGLLTTAIEKCCPDTLRFLQFVIDKRRPDLLPFIFVSFENRYRSNKGIVSARLSTASDVTGMEEKFKDLLKANGYAEVELEKTVDPDILGGFVLQIQDVRLDASLKTQLETLRRTLIFEKNG